eukprot:m.108093 g.108093  ORF g.108093 m.108093 type:complete len:51 (+) comp12699_c0_seq11:2817-2969(+)
MCKCNHSCIQLNTSKSRDSFTQVFTFIKRTLAKLVLQNHDRNGRNNTFAT